MVSQSAVGDTRPIRSHPPADDSPGTRLLTHSQTVAERAVKMAPTDRSITRTVALLHDIGKATPMFQRYLHGERVDAPTHHAPLGATITFHVLREQGASQTDALIGFLSVAKHHGALPDVSDYVERFCLNNADAVIQQATAIESDAASQSAANTLIQQATDGAVTWADISPQVTEKQGIKKILQTERRGVSSDADVYSRLLGVWTALITADKTAAADIPIHDFDCDAPAPATITEYIEDIAPRASPAVQPPAEQASLNDWRNHARIEAVSRFNDIATQQGTPAGVYTLTLPTGYGKTLTGMQTALEAASLHTGQSRVIYALPYTSIIEQTQDVITDAFDVTPADPEFTVHHYLTETRTESDELTDRDERFLGETWQAGVVLTTFVQLFESLAGPHNQQGTKVPQLQNAVVILDELQLLPMQWWRLAATLIDVLVSQYDATVLFMTATQPGIFTATGREQPPELVQSPEPKHYFDTLDRTEFNFHPSVGTWIENEQADSAGTTTPGSVPIDEAAEEVAETGQTTPVLSVCNTISSAQHLYQSVSESDGAVSVNELITAGVLSGDSVENVLARINPASKTPVIHVTSRHPPRIRQALLDVAGGLAARQQPVIAVTTQLVEAGVDVSFNTVYRDFAPVHNLIQVGGRCNRNGEYGTGEVIVWRLAGENGTSPSNAVYATGDGVATLRTSIKAIGAVGRVENGWCCISEAEMTTDVIDAYNQLLHQQSVGADWDADVHGLRCQALGEKSVIDTGDETVNAVVSLPDTELAKTVQAVENDSQEIHDVRVTVPYWELIGEGRADIATTDGVQKAGPDTYVVDSSAAIFDGVYGVGGVRDR